MAQNVYFSLLFHSIFFILFKKYKSNCFMIDDLVQSSFVNIRNRRTSACMQFLQGYNYVIIFR